MAPDLDAAERFLAASGRVLDRRRFERLFRDGDARPVVAAVAAYLNADGGFGHALEPDTRAPSSQPLALELALRTLHEGDAWDHRLVAGACEWLERNAPAEGGASFVTRTSQDWPHAPWMVPDAGLAASLIASGLIAGTLHARAVHHPWLERATELLWARIEGLDDGHPYELRAVLRFLQHVPDRARAEAAFEQVGRLILERRLVELDPDAPGEVHGPLDYAPYPDSMARRLFDLETIAAHLGRLGRGQQDDGGWTFNWLAWSPAAALEWRSSVSVDALVVLRANERL